jgi:hypothetical protein
MSDSRKMQNMKERIRETPQEMWNKKFEIMYRNGNGKYALK